MKSTFSLMAVLGLAIAAPVSAQDFDAEAAVDAQYDRTARVARQIWDWAELGYLENRSSGLLQAELAAAGFIVESGVAGIPTAFTAEFGSGGPVIAVLGEFDALPGLSQSDSPERATDDKSAAHGCGHNLFGAGSLTAAIAIAQYLETSGQPGRVRFFGTPAEEGGSGKVYMVRAGLFDDVDFTVQWHPGDENSAAAQTTLANRSAKFRFHGISSHAAAAPDQGRSALDGVEAFNMMANLMREHVPQDSRIHYVITAGGNAPNVIPDFAEVFYYVRHPQADGVDAIWGRLEDAARGAAMGTGTTVDWEVIHGNNPVLVNETLQRMLDGKLRSIGGFDYTDAEREYAARLAETLGERARPLSVAQEVQPYELSLGYGSTDVGDVSYATPTLGLSTATWVPGTSAHTWQSASASGMSIGFKGAQLAAKAMTMAAIELYEDGDLRAAATAEFEAERGADYQYKSLLGDREPPLDYRK